MFAAIAALIVWLGTFGPGGAPAQAALLNLTKQPRDVFADFISVEYNASIGAFTASGWAGTFDLDGLSPPDYEIIDGALEIDLYLTSAGIPMRGTLVIRGTIPALGAVSGTLLTGSISQFGFEDFPFQPDSDGQIFELLFEEIGGDLAGHYGNQAAVILTAGAWDELRPFRGVFTQDFANTELGVSDASGSPVPEPSSGMVMLSLLGCGLATRGLRRRRSR